MSGTKHKCGIGSVAQIPCFFVFKENIKMAQKDRITNQDPDQQKIIEALFPESRKNENQPLDTAVSDHSSEIKNRQSKDCINSRILENEASPFTTESSELTTIAKPAATPYRSSKDSSLRIREEGDKRIIVTGAFPPRHLSQGSSLRPFAIPRTRHGWRSCSGKTGPQPSFIPSKAMDKYLCLPTLFRGPSLC